jgi:hypothetical protein
MESDGRPWDLTLEVAATFSRGDSIGRHSGEALIVDVLFEQLEFLVAHAARRDDCPSTCCACARFDSVSRHLLAPFGNTTTQADAFAR